MNNNLPEYIMVKINNGGFRVLLARKRKSYGGGFFLMILSLILFLSIGVKNTDLDSSKPHLYLLFLLEVILIFFVFVYSAYGFIYHFFLNSYIVNGYLNFKDHSLEHNLFKNIPKEIAYINISSIGINYTSYERVRLYGFFYTEKLSGADNTLIIKCEDSTVIHCNFLCRNRKDILSIKYLIYYLKVQKGLSITYAERGKNIPS